MTVNSDGTITCEGTATGDVRFNFTNLVPSGIPNIGLKGGQTYWLSRRCVANYKTSPDGEILGFFGYDAGTTFIWQDNYVLVNVRLHFGTGTETNYTISPIIAVTEGGEVPYEPYNGTEYSTQVGQVVEITQRDKFTTVYAETDGVVVSGEFVQTLRDEINTKPTTMTGAFANRPTATFDYHVLYIATDLQNDLRTTLLPAGKDGSVSGNWISILSQEQVIFESEEGVNIGAQDKGSTTGFIKICDSSVNLIGKKIKIEIGEKEGDFEVKTDSQFFEVVFYENSQYGTTIFSATSYGETVSVSRYIKLKIQNDNELYAKSVIETTRQRVTVTSSQGIFDVENFTIVGKWDKYVYSVAIID